MKVKSAESYSTGKEGKVVEIVVFVESGWTINKLGIVVLSLQHFVDKVEGRDAC